MDKQFVVDQHGNDGSDGAKDGRRLRTDPVGAAELHDDRERADKEGNGDVLHDLRAIGHHQDQERCDKEHQRELQNDESSHLAEFFGSGDTAGSHLVGQRRSRQTDGTEAYGHRVSHQTDHCGEHRFESQSDQDGSRDGHSRSKAGHTFEHTTKTPRQEQYQQSLVRGHLDKLRLDGLNLLRLTEDVITEDGTDDNQNDREAGLEESLDD